MIYDILCECFLYNCKVMTCVNGSVFCVNEKGKVAKCVGLYECIIMIIIIIRDCESILRVLWKCKWCECECCVRM